MMIDMLNEAVKRASQTEMYRKKLADVSSVQNLKQFQELPYTTKQELRASYPYKNLGVNKRDTVEMHTTSGTSGSPTASYFTSQDLALSNEYVSKAWRNFGVSQNSTVQFMMSYGLFSGAALNTYAIQSLGGLVVPSGVQSTQKQIEMICDLGVDTIVATPSYYLCMYNHLRSIGVDPKSLGLKTGIAAGEAYSDELKNKISEIYNIRLYDHYGLCEVNTGIVYECSTCCRMAVLKDYVYAEVVDPETGQELPAGEYGELVLTSVKKDASPVLRYRTGDSAAIIEPSSGCHGCKGSVIISRIQGRVDDVVFYKGLLISPHEIRDLIHLRSNNVGVDKVKIEVVKDVDNVVKSIRVKVALVLPDTNIDFITSMERMLYAQTNVPMRVEQVPSSDFDQKTMKVKLVEYVTA